MNFLQIDDQSIETIEQSFASIAKILFNNYKINVNDNFYRLLDIEFYYYSAGKFQDPYIHLHDLQKETGRWYFHGSGIDITFGINNNYGGILIRGIGKVSIQGKKENDWIEYDVHGPVNVNKELTKKFQGVFSSDPNTFNLIEIDKDALEALMPSAIEILKTSRIGLMPNNTDANLIFHTKPYRFIACLENYKSKFKDKEKVIRNLVKDGSLSTDKAFKILGYKIILK